jgi:Domain of Unknown Function (DUF1080)
MFHMLKNLTSAVIALALIASSQLGFADEGGTAFTDENSAGADFTFQGEYKGTVSTDEGDKVYGAQVIALGEGNFTIVGFHGGLPGDGWMRGNEQTIVEGKLSDSVVRGKTDKAAIEIANDAISIIVDGKTIGKLAKVHRQSPTLGAKAPENATVLFDGTTAEHFEQGKIIEGNLLGATNAFSKTKLGDHELHLEFRTPFMPSARGQGRGNSGVYLQGRYELQVLDSFGLEGKNNECGGIYSISEPIVNMCFPPLSWQTYDMVFTAARYDADGNKTQNARATIKHNGVVIHDNLDLTHGTPGYHAEGPDPDSLFLQDHGNPVAFRNIWIIAK